jgi:hypothetical protein
LRPMTGIGFHPSRRNLSAYSSIVTLSDIVDS